MDERIWNLYACRGRSVYLTIVDDCGAPFGHINVDGIEERLSGAIPPADDDWTPTGSKLRRKIIVEGLSAARAIEPARGSSSLACSPNPFNPVAEIVIRSTPEAILTVSVYDVAGRALCDFSVRTNARGEATIRWKGTDRRGAPLPSGIYVAVLKNGSRALASGKLVLAR